MPFYDLFKKNLRGVITDLEKKKALKDAYKTKKEIGGVCAIRCSGNKRVWLQSTRNIEGFKNRFDFAVAVKSCPDPSMREEYREYGIDSFTFEVLEEITKGDSQTDKEFADDVKALYEMWLEKSQQGDI